MVGERDGKKNGWRLPHLGAEGREIIERSIGDRYQTLRRKP